MLIELLQKGLDLPARRGLMHPHAAGGEPELLNPTGERRRLPVLPELQAVLEIAQEDVGLAQRRVFLVLDEAFVGQAVQGEEGVLLAQPRIPAAVLQL